MSEIYLISTEKTQGKHVSMDTVSEFESTILKDDLQVKRISPSLIRSFSTILFFAKTLKKIKIDLFKILKSNFVKKSASKKAIYFTIMMGLDYNKIFPYSVFTHKARACYLFDAWPNTHNSIEDFVRDCKPNILFITSSEVAKILNKKFVDTDVFWIPEGINAQEYRHKPYEEKSIDILSLGRKYDIYHDLIKDYFDKSDKTYLYEKIKGEIIFPTREEFIDGLAKAKISICVPSNITHPERAGDIETMTIRYLQSMVSKCLIVGHAPKEMVELFGYNPVIEIDMKQPTEQLESILDNYSSYFSLIEKNYEKVIKDHTWARRWSEIKSKML